MSLQSDSIGSGEEGLHLNARQVVPVPAGAVPVMEAVNISKAFGATTALVDVSLKAYAGRILALLGDNGAGKSTLIKILCGVFPPDRGELRFGGEKVVFANPAQARARGIATVFQDLAVCDLLSVTRNVVLGREPQKGLGPFKWFDVKRAEEMARSALLQLGVRWERSVNRWRSPGRCSSARPSSSSTSRPRRWPCARPAACSTISPRRATRARRSS